MTSMAYQQPGEASPSFAQTVAELDLDDSDDVLSYLDDDAIDLASEVGGAEAYEMRSSLRGNRSPRRNHQRPVGVNGSTLRRRASADSVASFQLYTPDEELVVRRKFDRKLVLFVALLYMLSFLDRSNIGNARIAGMDEDLQTNPPRDDWYEWSLTAFYITYIAFEWMSLLWKLIPAHIYVSVVILSWGLTASLQAISTSYPMLIALRLLLGIGEAAFTGIPFYLSFFFKREELAFRTAIFISAAPLATSFASTLAWIIVKLASYGPIAPWRLLFLVEGFPSVIVSVIAWHAIPDSPQTASYLTKREKKVALLRLRSDLPATDNPPPSESRNASAIKVRDVLTVIRDPVAWMTAAMFFSTNLAVSSLPVFLPKIMTEMGHDALTSQALSAPPYLVAFVVVLFTAHTSDRLQTRSYLIIFHALSSAFGYAILALSETLHIPPFARYIAIYPAAVGCFNVVTLTIAWCINNQPSESGRGSSFALMQLIGQCGPLVGTRLYPDRERPYYTRGMETCAWAMLVVAVLSLVLRLYLQIKNKRLEKSDASRLIDDINVEEERLVGRGKGRQAPAQAFRYML